MWVWVWVWEGEKVREVWEGEMFGWTHALIYPFNYVVLYEVRYILYDQCLAGEKESATDDGIS